MQIGADGVNESRGNEAPAIVKRLEFSNLPLVEVDVRVAFGESLPWTLPESVGVMNAIESRFPNLLDHPFGDEVPGSIEGLTFHTRENLLQSIAASDSHGETIAILHRQMLIVRWVSKPSKPAYPRYPRLRDDALWLYETIGNRWPTPPTVVQMRYTNFVPDLQGRAPGWFLRDGNVLRESTVREMHHFEVAMRLDPEGSQKHDVDVRMRATQAHSEEAAKGTLLMTIAGSVVGPDDNAFDILDRCHETLLTMFDQFLSNEAKAEWGLTR